MDLTPPRTNQNVCIGRLPADPGQVDRRLTAYEMVPSPPQRIDLGVFHDATGRPVRFVPVYGKVREIASERPRFRTFVPGKVTINSDGSRTVEEIETTRPEFR